MAIKIKVSRKKLKDNNISDSMKEQDASFDRAYIDLLGRIAKAHSAEQNDEYEKERVA